MSSCASPSELRIHFEKLKLVNSEGASGFDEEFNYLVKSTDESVFGDCASAHKSHNRPKNRYANVLPLEETRVVLNGLEGCIGADFINANFVSGTEKGDRTYISTQGPLEGTAADFWRMVWEQKVLVVVMLTRLIENGKPKCFHYYPKNSQKTKIFSESGHTFEVTLLKKTKSFHLIERTIQLSLLHSPYSQTKAGPRTLHHFQYIEWPDHGLPESTTTFRELLSLVDTVQSSELQKTKQKKKEVKNRSSDDMTQDQHNAGDNDEEHEEVDTDYDSDEEEEEEEERKRPIVVHCSAGIGRTGTFCTVHSILTKLKEYHSKPNPPSSPYPDLDILERVLQLRKERIGMVQTRDQYEFCYRAVLEALEDSFGSKETE